MSPCRNMLIPSSPPSLSALIFCFLFLSFFAGGRTQAQATTDTEEARILSLLFSRWGISSSLSIIPWNTSGDICSGSALGDFLTFDNPNFNPGIICDCSFNNNSICHITRLKAYKLGIAGRIPGELESLKYLENVDLAKNYLTGPLPTFFGNFSAMKYLSIGMNSLSGEVPKELGNLQNLISLGIGTNNFSGPLPPELGNLTSLEKLYVDSLRISGEIPSTFGQLSKLTIMYVSDNNLVGKVPDFIGNLTNIGTLRLHGNSFQGPIPSSFVNLTKLTNLRIGDLVDGRSSLAFIKNMKSLSTLIIRNSKVSGTIPLNIEDYKKLEYLDLSFNNLIGALPPSLFNLDSLKFLFLGNNSLSGSLPDQKSRILLNIDLSYNELSGSLPSWVSEDNLQLNVVANKFVIDKSIQNVIPWSLSCLQKNIPCGRGSPTYYSFAINCGGDKIITSSDGTVYEIDNQNLATASYYVTDTARWAVSSVGSFVGNPNPRYTENNLLHVMNTSDSELFQTARISSSSLRYYGLGLENGNYTVKLQFAETAFPNNYSWMSLGRRVFNIYIQGNLVAEDFDIREQAGAASFSAVEREYTISVTDNFLEIHFLWAGKGTCCVPYTGYYGPLISAISVTPNFKPTVSNRRPMNGLPKKNAPFIAEIVSSVAALCFLVGLGICIWRKRRWLDLDKNEDFLGLNAMLDYFSYAELRTATNGFSLSNKLGEGGFGSVFKGKLTDGRIVAVKQLSEASLQGKSQFISEIATISTVQHRNLVKLYGCCCERDKRLLVYEYQENRSLDQALFGKNFHLDWPNRFAICLGIARGLAYLHEESRLRIVHRDVKASNILLDADLNPKISDFGLAKLYDEKKTHISTTVAGTIGYLAPEYAMRGHLTEKVDVFAFGVLALEILCGRRNTESSMGEANMFILEWAWDLHENNNDLQMMDPSLPSYDEEEALRVIGVALLCTQAFSSVRPSISRVVAMLVGDVEVNEVASKPAYMADWQFDDISRV